MSRAKPPIGSPLDGSHPLARGLAWCFPQRERAGDPRDVVGRRPLVRTGAVDWVAGRRGPVLYYPSGSGDYTAVPLDAAWDTAGRSYSFGAAAVYDGSGGSGYAVLASQAPGASFRNYLLVVPGGELQRYDAFPTGIVLTVGHEYRILYTFAADPAAPDTSGTETFHVFDQDGTYRTATRTGTVPATVSADWRIGNGAGFHSWKGAIDAPSLWVGRVVTAAGAAAWATDPFAAFRRQRRRVPAVAAPVGGFKTWYAGRGAALGGGMI